MIAGAVSGKGPPRRPCVVRCLSGIVCFTLGPSLTCNTLAGAQKKPQVVPTILMQHATPATRFIFLKVIICNLGKVRCIRLSEVVSELDTTHTPLDGTACMLCIALKEVFVNIQ